MSLIELTGGPEITGTANGTLALPLPDYDNWMQVEEENETMFIYLSDGSGRVENSGARNRAVFRFGYRVLIQRIGYNSSVKLIIILRERSVTFKPRTPNGGEPAATTYTCRVVSDIPMTRHLKLGYDIEVELEEIDALA